MQKVAEAGHKAQRTRAMASEKAGKDLAYQAAERTGILWPAGSRWAATAAPDTPGTPSEDTGPIELEETMTFVHQQD